MRHQHSQRRCDHNGTRKSRHPRRTNHVRSTHRQNGRLQPRRIRNRHRSRHRRRQASAQRRKGIAPQTRPASARRAAVERKAIGALPDKLPEVVANCDHLNFAPLTLKRPNSGNTRQQKLRALARSLETASISLYDCADCTSLCRVVASNGDALCEISSTNLLTEESQAWLLRPSTQRYR